MSVCGCVCYECTFIGECCGDTVEIKATGTNVKVALLSMLGGSLGPCAVSGWAFAANMTGLPTLAS